MQESDLKCGTPLTCKIINTRKSLLILVTNVWCYSLKAASFHLFTGITGTLTAMEECTVWFYLVKLVLCGCIRCLIKKVTVTIIYRNTWWTWNLKSLKCCVFKDNFCCKMFCWGLCYCFQEIIHMYFPLQAPLLSTVTFLVQMNTVCRSYCFLMSMLSVYLSLTRHSTNLCKEEKIKTF